MKKSTKILIIVLAVIIGLCGVGVAGVAIYASDYRTLDADFEYVLYGEDVILYDDMVHFKADSDVGVVFYQGGRVDYLAYAPLMQQLQAENVNVFLVDTPFNMACFGVNKASAIIDEYTEITNWYIGGHSLGGVVANMYAANHSDEINGLIMLGIYLSSDYDVENTITIYGSNDLRVGDAVTYTTNVHIIDGGNHAQFGNYGPNDGDGEATITTAEQQAITVELIMEFIAEKNN